MSYIQYLKITIILLLLGVCNLHVSNLKACETSSSIEQEICEGDTFNFNEQAITIAGIYLDTLLNSEECDSIITLTLIVHPKFNKNINATICQGDSILVGLTAYQSSGNYTDTLKSILGCDSIVQLNLTVNPIITTNLNPTICQGDSISVGNNIYKTSGNYNDTLLSNTFCDSIIHTVLTVIPSSTRNISVTICNGESFSIGSNVYDSSGSYTDTLTSSVGCDSIILLNLSVQAAIQTNIIQSICQGETYTFDFDTISTAGTYQETYISQNGCDSIVTLDLSVNPTFSNQQSLRICEGEIVEIGTHQYTTSGNYIDTLKTILGCDSIIATQLTVDPIQRDTIFPTICQGSTFQVGDQIYTNTGVYIDTFASSTQCDSIVITNLTVTNSFKTTINETLCEGEIYDWNGKVFTENGTHIDTLISQIGCDSIVTLNLVFLPISITDISATICNNENYQVGNNLYDISGNYIDTLKSINNCDSIVNLNLTVLAAISRSINATICQGKSFSVGDSTYSNAGIYTTVLKSFQNCDSTVLLNLRVAPQSQTSLTPTICKGSIFSVGTKSYSQSGTYIDTLLNQSLCDSIITTILTVKDPTSEQVNITVCPGQTVTIGQNTYSQQGLYTDTLKSIFGCDSIIVLRLTIQNSITFNQTINICQGESYTIGANTYSTTGTFKDTLASSGGCDSIVTTNLFVRDSYQLTDTATICPGDSIQFGNQIIKTAGTYTNPFLSIYGCDSTVTLTVTVLRSENETVDRSSCIGETIRIEGVNYTNDTTFSFKYTNAVDCDSIIEYHLRFYPTYQKNIQQSVCVGQKFQNYTINQDTLVVLNLTSINGCDSIVQVQISAIDKFTNSINSEICFGTNYNGVIITKDTVLTNTYTSSQGCDSTVINTIKVIPGLEMSTSTDTVINPGSPVTLFASGADSYLWNTGATSASIVVRPTTNTVYTVTGTATNGCTQEIEINVNVNACVVKGATYFTPNGDGSHDKWKLKGTECLSDFTLQIINRWGEVIFETKDESESWNGQFKDNEAPEGVYFYILEGVSPQDNNIIQQNGYIHLTR